ELPPGHLMCTPEHCSGFSHSFEWLEFCECQDGSGKPIPDCMPQRSLKGVPTHTCYNRVTDEQRNISEEDCQALRDRDRRWVWRTCYCCCRGDPGPWACESKVPLGTMKCSPEVCSEPVIMRAFCECLAWGQPIPFCDPKNYLTPLVRTICYNTANHEQVDIRKADCLRRGGDWVWKDCYCCCFGFPYGPKIRISTDEVKSPQDIDVSDTVQSASVEIMNGKLSVTWKPAEVSFSQGVVAG